MQTSLRLNALGLLVVLAAAGVFGCATKSGSGGGQERIASEERIADPAIRDLTPQDSGMPASRTSPGMRAELAARNATGEVRNILMDVLFDFDQEIGRAHV